MSLTRSYRAALVAALAERRTRPTPPVLVPLLFLAVGLAAAIALAIGAGTAEQPARHFREGGALTTVSALLMATAALGAAATGWRARHRPDRGRHFWWLCAVGFGWFAIDEVYEFHEYFGYLLGDRPGRQVLIFRSWNDIIVIGYGLGALLVCGGFLPEILRLPAFPWLLLLAGGLYVLHTGVDSVFEGRYRSVILEESAKLCSGGMFALAFLTAFRALGAPPPAPDPLSRTSRP